MEGILTGPIGIDCLPGKSDVTSVPQTLSDPLPNREEMGKGALRKSMGPGREGDTKDCSWERWGHTPGQRAMTAGRALDWCCAAQDGLGSP